MGRLAFYTIKGIKMFFAFFAIVFELAFIFASPILLANHTQNDWWYWFYLISAPMGAAAMVATIKGIDWEELLDFDYYDSCD